MELWTGEFLDTFFKEGTEVFFIPIGDKELYDAGGNSISQEEFKKQIDEFHVLYPIIMAYKYEINSLHVEGDYATVKVETSWVGLNQHKRAVVRHRGTSTLRLKRTLDIRWDIIQARVVGWNSGF